VFQTLEEGRGKVIESELFERGTSLRNKAIAHLLATSINYYPMSVAASQTASHSARSVPASRMARRSGWRAEHDQNCGVGLDPDRRRSRSGCAQDIAGIEDCTKTSGLDKRTGCLQSNVNFLQRLVTKNALDARNKLDDAASEIVALKTAVTRLQKTVDQLQAAQKVTGDKKPEAK